jgi:hypothetical protein
MFEKSGKFYADWRERDGSRVRKSFTSKRAALAHENEMKALAHPKRRARGLQSPKDFAPKLQRPRLAVIRQTSNRLAKP